MYRASVLKRVLSVITVSAMIIGLVQWNGTGKETYAAAESTWSEGEFSNSMILFGTEIMDGNPYLVPWRILEMSEGADGSKEAFLFHDQQVPRNGSRLSDGQMKFGADQSVTSYKDSYPRDYLAHDIYAGRLCRFVLFDYS